jgi:hypothetical protein
VNQRGRVPAPLRRDTLGGGRVRTIPSVAVVAEASKHSKVYIKYYK